MKSVNDRVFASDLLRALWVEIGDSKFGYRIQGLFAHTLIRMGGIIREIKSQGHPDLILDFGLMRLFVQVKSTRSQSVRQNFVLSSIDNNGIKPTNPSEIGYFAILECVSPITWMLIKSENKIDNLLDKSVPLVELRALADKEFSEDCTAEFVSLVIENQAQLRELSFCLLRNRALRGIPF